MRFFIDRTPAEESNVLRSLSARLAECEAARDELSAIVNGIRDVYYAFDQRWRFTDVNAQAERMWGRTRAQLIGHVVWQLYPQLPGKEFYTRVMGAMEQQKPVQFEARSDVCSGWYESYVYPCSLGLRIFARDITVRKNAEEVRECRLQEAQCSNAAKEEFLAILAHELRNPLSPIRAAVQIMRLRSDDPEILQQQENVIERQVCTIARIVEDLFDVSRIRHNKLELQAMPVNVIAAVENALETSQSMIHARNHQLTVSLPQDPVFVQGDPTRLEQIFWNLIINAAKYTPSGGRISVTAALEDGYFVLRIRDTGTGIAPELLHHIFDLCAQVERRHSSVHGLGIGLTLVRHLVDAHGGSVRAFSAGPGQGSEFVVNLPVLYIEVDAQRPPEPAPETVSAAPQRVLVVEDDSDSRHTLKMMLELWGHTVDVAADGTEGVTKAKLSPPNVAFVDVGLPGMDGYEVARQVRAALGKQPYLIALTGFGQESVRRHTAEADFDRHLVKPASLDEIKRVLAEAAGRTVAT
ncbi:MAG TPA: ATP-binding protein [Planctomycetota bacterium]|jgi:PAS domain S-box-containing protein